MFTIFYVVKTRIIPYSSRCSHSVMCCGKNMNHLCMTNKLGLTFVFGMIEKYCHIYVTLTHISTDFFNLEEKGLWLVTEKGTHGDNNTLA